MSCIWSVSFRLGGVLGLSWALGISGDCSTCAGHPWSTVRLFALSSIPQLPLTPPPPLPQVPPPSTKKTKRKNPARSGAILPRKARRCQKPGRKYNPGSLRNVRRKTQKDNVKLKLEDKLLIGQCVWASSNYGGLRARNSAVKCCKNKDCYRVWREQASSDVEFATRNSKRALL